MRDCGSDAPKLLRVKTLEPKTINNVQNVHSTLLNIEVQYRNLVSNLFCIKISYFSTGYYFAMDSFLVTCQLYRLNNSLVVYLAK
jgi:hypothetical protein